MRRLLSRQRLPIRKSLPRNASAMAPGSVSTLRNEIQRAEELKQRRTALGARFELSAISDSSVLRQHALAVRSAPAMTFISPAWWRAQRVFFGFVKERTRVKRAEMARSFDDLASYCDENNAYSADQAVAKCVGAVFKGIDTDLNPFLRVAEWADRVRTNLPAGDEINNQLRNLLLEGTAEQIESLATMSKDPMMNTLRKVLTLDATRALPIEAQANAAAQAAERAQQISDAVTRLRLKPDFKIKASDELAASIARVRDLRESLDSSQTAKNVLGNRFQGHESDRDDILACAKHVRNVDASGLPTKIREWLLRAEARKAPEIETDYAKKYWNG